MSLFEGLDAMCQQPLAVSIKFKATDLEVETNVKVAHESHPERKCDLPPAHIGMSYIYYLSHLSLSVC